ncbi:predicted protein [Thalassiosira pseudonana CCMP1335]|uniref:Mitochondrial import inner membrane translocase subunit TIM22 n=1 Tax=Thalassiosira pseudonana TaxID=35128 RepID=B8C6E2_THAPS|nr:predicted protein [Thalassiosira pseudonana CCMP1335]EED90790.1 predicted protein [Thalassiosira pseudonana CCMP1335]
MSSWDRTRSIPWSRATPVSPSSPSGENEDIDLNRERVFRDLAREAAQEEKEREERKKLEDDGVRGDGSVQTTTTETQQSNNNNNNNSNKVELNFLGYQGRPYQTSDLLRNAAFGATIGSITGMCFGFMDSLRTASSSSVLKSASRSAQGKFVFQGTYRSGMFFGAFFSLFHTVKYGTRVLVDPGDVGEIGVGSLVALGGLFARREWRASLPYAVMLVGMDGFHVLMRD